MNWTKPHGEKPSGLSKIALDDCVDGKTEGERKKSKP